MIRRISTLALFCALLFTALFLTAGTSSAQVRGITATGSSGGNGGHLEITIETFGTLANVAFDCPVEHIHVTIPIPYPADCHLITQTIYDSLSVVLAGKFAVTMDQPNCTVWFYRNVDPECTYFEAKVAGEWVGMTFVVVDRPTPVKAISWGLLKSGEWRAALRGEYVAPRRKTVSVTPHR